MLILIVANFGDGHIGFATGGVLVMNLIAMGPDAVESALYGMPAPLCIKVAYC
jgi:hypothetical protein